MLQKKSSGVEPHYLNVWLPAHDGDADMAEKVVSNNIKCSIQFVIYLYLLNILQEQYTEELTKIHRPEIEDPRSVPFNIDAAYDAGGGTPHGGYVKISIVLC
jgi:hypothetical protein